MVPRHNIIAIIALLLLFDATSRVTRDGRSLARSLQDHFLPGLLEKA